jgi:hypothetical protein
VESQEVMSPSIVIIIFLGDKKPHLFQTETEVGGAS